MPVQSYAPPFFQILMAVCGRRGFVVDSPGANQETQVDLSLDGTSIGSNLSSILFGMAYCIAAKMKLLQLFFMRFNGNFTSFILRLVRQQIRFD
jgi:hypothetical protein